MMRSGICCTAAIPLKPRRKRWRLSNPNSSARHSSAMACWRSGPKLPALDPQALLATLKRRWQRDRRMPGRRLVKLARIGRLDEAHETAEAAARRFPLPHGFGWTCLLFAGRAGDRNGEFAAIQSASDQPRLVGGGAQAFRAHEPAGEFEQSRAVLEQAVARNPLDAYAHGMLADVLWRSAIAIAPSPTFVGPSKWIPATTGHGRAAPLGPRVENP